MFYTQIAKNSQDKQFFSLFSEFHDKSGESDKNWESRRQHIKSGDSRSNREGWNLWYTDHVLKKTERQIIPK